MRKKSKNSPKPSKAGRKAALAVASGSLLVFGWQGHRHECPPAPNGSRQTREICAAKSMAAVARAAGVKYPRQLFNLCDTGNAYECELALSSPGTVFWRPIDGKSEEFKANHRIGPTDK